MEITAFSPGALADRKLRRPVLMLKDYLLDDLSSCSSNGFKSFPRRPQCCPSTVRFLLDIDLKARGEAAAARTRRTTASRRAHHHRDRPSLKRNPSKAASTTVSALHRASMKVINAVKLLPFPSVAKSATSGKARRSLFPRSLSRKLLSKRFWRRPEPEIGRWRLFREFLAEKDPQADQLSTSHSQTASATLTPRVSASSSSGHNGSSSSWDSSEFGAVDTVSTFSGNSVSSDGDAVVSAEKDLLLPPKPAMEEKVKADKVSGRVGVTVGGNEEEESPGATPPAACTEDWPNEEKEQFSPVSVLDCPFKDDDNEEISSTSECSPEHIGGSRKKNGHKSQRIKSLSQLEPLNLDGRLAFSELDHGPVAESTMQSYSSPSTAQYAEENETNVGVEELLKAIKINNPAIGLDVDNLLSDFCIEKLESGSVSTLEALEVVQDWVNGTPRDISSGWEVKSGRAAYVRDMEEKCGSWRDLKEEREEVAMEIEDEVWRSLMEEILLDL
ncbi:uncharacterized protein LOC116202591 [Punica granatum]|uniref:Uncharacterized protein LOC116202591 n=1 Tax=Punica granatum TaxID=22663 RepID=A0A218XRF5_PUNGR|nr:uncharacterized protein LOC116202591 [Punica granatum]OWM87775.1 hypothetical protein CDL15_Pgr016471 [Punica granatum]